MSALRINARPLTTRGELIEELERVDKRPLILVYTGHGSNVSIDKRGRHQTEICFSDGNVTLDDLVRKVNPLTPYAVFVIDACWSADVDIRVPVDRSGHLPRLAVLSADSLSVKTGENGGTAMGNSLIDALVCGDSNGDELVDDLELLQSLQLYMKDNVRFAPRLRRQAWAALPVYRVTNNKEVANCRENASSTLAPRDRSQMLASFIGPRLFSLEKSYRANPLGAADALPRTFWGVTKGQQDWIAPTGSHEIVTGTRMQLRSVSAMIRSSRGFALTLDGGEMSLLRLDSDTEMIRFPAAKEPQITKRIERGSWATLNEGLYLWHGGLVEDLVETVDGKRFSREQLRAIPCPEAFGQCFEVIK
ncbi:MAG: hypothetical protein JXA30_10130 [Deltaproteobacteria bacterium]|nr:hypothetical protein [Deltaproteobacteria bacterium]